MTHPPTQPNHDQDATQPIRDGAISAELDWETTLPDRLGRYAVLEVLGAGGFGKVLLARDEELNRHVAIKIPRRERFPDRGALQRFLEEARTAARLRHPGIVTVFDVGAHQDWPFIVLEYIRGRTLSHLLQHEQLSWPAAARMIAEIADALQHAHEQGFVHRDIKPQNILLDSDDRPHVADFGLALKHRDPAQEDRDVVGTTFYMAPEQVRAENHRIDGRTDLWSLGVIFYRMLTGRLPFDGSSPREVVQAILYEAPESPRQFNSAVPEELERICLRCLSRQMSERYRTAADLAEDLGEWLRFMGGGSGGSSHRRRMVVEPPDAPVAPRGLRSFEQEDADFFLKLLPGPRDRDGLPTVLRFWKKRIEEREPDRTFRVGVLYGPSGCGKSSLVKAGLLPRLSADVVSLYFDTTSRDTEDRLLRALHRKFRALPQDISLPEALRLLRERSDLRGGRKVLIVFDQFEQWLDAWQAGSDADLVQALRHCDGGQVQAAILVRDDFWLAVSRFMRLLEIGIVEGVNGMLVDSFDLAHARRVLRELGVAYGRLPETAAQHSESQNAFLEQATAELAENNRLYPVRLAVFVEMVKDRPWVPATLEEMGGAEGVGVAFLESSVGSRAAPSRRRHESAARQVLAALLPPAGQIKGSVRSRAELLHASGYADRPHDFDELMRLLDVELRLLTPARRVDEESSRTKDDEPPPASATVYQLTHDFLVPSVREWLERQLRGTSRGRAQLMLQEQADLWSHRPSPRLLPSTMEWLSLRLRTSRRDWTEPQRRMMQAAARRIAGRALAAVCLLLVASLGTWGVYDAARRRSNERQAILLVSRLQDVQVSDVPQVVNEMAPLRRWVEPPLRQLAADSSKPLRSRLRASIALLPHDGGQVDWLTRQLVSEQTPPEDFLIAREALRPYGARVAQSLHRALDDPLLPPANRFRAACALAGFDPKAKRWEGLAQEVVALLLRQPGAYATHWIAALRPAAATLRAPLIEAVRGADVLETARVGVLALYTFNHERGEFLAELLADARDGRYRAVMELLKRDPEQSRRRVRRRYDEVLAVDPADDAEAHAQHLANLTLALCELGDLAPLREHAVLRADPRLRTRLIHGMSPECMDAAMLLPLILDEQDDSPAYNVALLALWRHRDEPFAASVRARLVDRLAQTHRSHPDPEAHAAAGLLLRSWDAQRHDALERELAAAGFDPSLPWYINPAGETMVVLDPRRFSLPGYTPPAELQYPFAIAATEVTLKRFRSLVPQFRPDSSTDGRIGRLPVLEVPLVHHAAYCNALSREEKLPQDEWCYPPPDELGPANCDPLAGFPDKTGYRLPTEAEWEFACRCGSVTSRFTGEQSAALQFYAWDRVRSDTTPQPVGQLLPNPFGLFDIFGNAGELCIAGHPAKGHAGPVQYKTRGQNYLYPVGGMTASESGDSFRGAISSLVGFRVVRTMPPSTR